MFVLPLRLRQIKRLCARLTTKAVAFETSCVYNVVYVFFRRCKKSFYVLVTANFEKDSKALVEHTNHDAAAHLVFSSICPV